MGHYSAVAFLVFALCLFACVCESVGEASEEDKPSVITKVIAQQAVDAAKISTKKACDNARNYTERAKGILEKVETFKNKAEVANSNAQEVAENNQDAAGIVANIKTIFSDLSALHLGAKDKLEKTIASLGKWLSAAEKLESEFKNEISPNEGVQENYSQAQDKALGIKSNAEALDKNITDELKIINEVQSTAETIEQNAKKAQVKNFHVNVIIAVAKIETMVGKANGIFTSTGKERDAVHESVQQTKEHCTNDLIKSYDIVKDKCKRADDALKSAEAAVKQAQNAMTAITEQKRLAATALENVQKEEKDVNTAEEEANAAKNCVTTAGQNVDVLTTALQAVKTSLTNANNAKQEIKTALSTTTSKPSPEEVEETLIKGAQTVPTTALTGGKAPAPGAKNDSAMTVSVPLLVALIASAVLQ